MPKDRTTVQNAPILRMARTAWKNVQMACRGQTASFSSMLIRTGSATRATRTAHKESITTLCLLPPPPRSSHRFICQLLRNVACWTEKNRTKL
uniref:Erb-b2 receptor tyrosine kinase 4 n=1 Tax=Molossus molossus TaxID=27622 RepID=A0A7J8FQP8_MOLMO|nr:erb-b2 receptor tyrosine kinase 4 [Molossus molossus]